MWGPLGMYWARRLIITGSCGMWCKSLQFVWEKGGVFQVGVSCYMGVITVLGTQ